ncbi:MAG: HAD family hydrolase [Planctomycetes bacterium]|nr:HAD family hydrolase [Planctomycetota bacterium]
MSQTKCVIFDCDGVLVDTEKTALKALHECLQELNIHVCYDEMYQLGKGANLNILLETICGNHGVPLPEGFIAHFRKHLNNSLAKGVEPIDGVKELVMSLQLPFAVASNGPQDKMKQTLGLSGLWSYFEGNIFSAYDINAWKPEPDLYLYAAKTLGFSADEALVVEDSVYGVIAAKKAGMEVIGLALDDDGEELLEKGAKVFHSMRDIHQYFEKADFCRG